MKKTFLFTAALFAPLSANALVFTVAGQGDERSLKAADIESYKQFIAENEFSASVRVFGWGGCSGTVIDDHWVITAAHCPTYGVQSHGVESTTEKGFTRYEMPLTQEAIVKETPWGAKNTWYIDGVDIVLMRLPEPMEHVVPAKIFQGEWQDLEPGMDVVQCGYGGWNGKVCGTNKLSASNDHWIQACMDRDVSATDDGEVSFYTETPLETSVVSGDSGGGIYTYDEQSKQLTIIGVTSVGAGACGGYPSIAAYKDWINQVIAENRYVSLVDTEFTSAKFQLSDRVNYAASYSWHHADNTNFEKTFFTKDGGNESVFNVVAGENYQIELLIEKEATDRKFDVIVEGYKVAKSIDVSQSTKDSVKIVVNTFTAPDEELDIKVIPVLTEKEKNDPELTLDRIVFDYVGVKHINE